MFHAIEEAVGVLKENVEDYQRNFPRNRTCGLFSLGFATGDDLSPQFGGIWEDWDPKRFSVTHHPSCLIALCRSVRDGYSWICGRTLGGEFSQSKPWILSFRSMRCLLSSLPASRQRLELIQSESGL